MAASDLSSRSEVIALIGRFGIHPQKHLGQSFLVDRCVLGRIAEEARSICSNKILEIGAGLGTVTLELAHLCPTVVALEIDPRLMDVLAETVGDREEIELVRQDFLSFDFEKTFGDEQVFVFGSIPYRITAPILKKLTECREYISAALLLTQEEVAHKIKASPGPEGSSLGVMLYAYADISVIERVPRKSFHPVPRVDSTLWLLRFLPHARFSADPGTFFALTRTLYGKRRKMIRRALRDLVSAKRVDDVLVRSGLDGTRRGDTLSIEELDRLARVVDEEGTGGLPLRDKVRLP